MSWLDPMTMSVATALVVTVCGVIFLFDTVVHAESPAARTWSVAFMAGILTVASYLAWTFLEDGWAAAGIGNGAFVTTTGCMWLGCRRYNARAMRVPILVVLTAVAGTIVATLVRGPDGGAWAGAVVMFPALAVLAGLGSAEARRAPLVGQGASIGLAAVLAVQSVYYVLRTGVYLTSGPDSELFIEWFGTPSTSMITIVLTITAVISIAVLRATERGAPTSRPETMLGLSVDGYLDAESFRWALDGYLERAGARRDQLAVIALRMEDLKQIAAAFGAEEAQQLTARWRSAAQAGAPLSAFLGDLGPGVILVGMPAPADGTARRVAARLSRRILDELTSAETVLTPVLGVGVAISTDGSEDGERLINTALQAAERSAAELGAVVVL